jgi:TonB family protein
MKTKEIILPFSYIIIFSFFLLNFETLHCQEEINTMNSFTWFNQDFARKYAVNDAKLIDEHEIGFNFSKDDFLEAYKYNTNGKKILFSGLSVQYSNSIQEKEPLALRAYVQGRVYFELLQSPNIKYCNYVPLDIFDSLFDGNTKPFTNLLASINSNQQNISKQFLDQIFKKQETANPIVRKVFFIEKTELEDNNIYATISYNFKEEKIQDSLRKVVHQYNSEYKNYLFLYDNLTNSNTTLIKISEELSKKLSYRFSKIYGKVRSTNIFKRKNNLTFIIETNDGFKEIPLKNQRFYSKQILNWKSFDYTYFKSEVKNNEILEIVSLPLDYLNSIEQLNFILGPNKIRYKILFNQLNKTYKFNVNGDFLQNDTWELKNKNYNNIVANGSYQNGLKQGQWNEFLHSNQGKKCSVEFNKNKLVNQFGECEIDIHHNIMQLAIDKIETFPSISLHNNDSLSILGWKKNNNIFKDSTIIFYEVNVEYPGGFKAMSEFIQNNLNYPQDAIEYNIQGKCYILVAIDNVGNISKVGVERGIIGCQECDKEAIRVVKMMSGFKPAKINGLNVNSYYIIPIDFRLE